MARFTPPTPISRRLGRRLRQLREECGLTQEQAAARLDCSQGRIGRIESGDIKPRPRDVLEILVAYGVPHDDETGRELQEMARQLRETGWWRQLRTLPNRYVTFVAYEAEADELLHFEPLLVPSLLQTPAYAEALIRAGHDDNEVVNHRAESIARRQKLLTTRQPPLRLQALITEAALMLQIGDTDLMREQLEHLMNVAAQPNVRVQLLPLAAGPQLAVHGGFQVLTFDGRDPPVGYVETLAGALFLESADEIQRLTEAYGCLKSHALPPKESARFLKERIRAIG